MILWEIFGAFRKWGKLPYAGDPEHCRLMDDSPDDPGFPKSGTPEFFISSACRWRKISAV